MEAKKILNKKGSSKRRKRAQYLVEFIIIAAPMMIFMVFAIQTMVSMFTRYWSLYTFSSAVNGALNEVNYVPLPVDAGSDIFGAFRGKVFEHYPNNRMSLGLENVQIFEMRDAAPVFIVAEFRVGENLPNAHSFAIPVNRAFLFPVVNNILDGDLTNFFREYYGVTEAGSGDGEGEGEAGDGEGSETPSPDDSGDSPLGKETETLPDSPLANEGP